MKPTGRCYTSREIILPSWVCGGGDSGGLCSFWAFPLPGLSAPERTQAFLFRRLVFLTGLAAVSAAALFQLLSRFLRNLGRLFHNRLLPVTEADRLKHGFLLHLFPARFLAAAGDGRQIRGNRRIILLCLTAAEDGNILIAENADGFRAVLHTDLHPAAQKIHLYHSAAALRGIHKGLHLGGAAQQILIGVLLVFQAAHQPSAGTGDFRGIQAKILGLGHLDGHRLEILQKACAAEGPSADSQSAYHLRLVPNADLPQLDPGVENRGQIFHQLPEIHALIGSKEEKDLAAVKGHLSGHQLHIQAVLGDLLLADIIGFFLFAPVFGNDPLILGCCHTKYTAQWGHHLPFRNGVVAAGADAELRTPGSVDNDMVAGLQLQSGRVKKVDLLSRAELNIHHLDSIIDFFHFAAPLYISVVIRRGWGHPPSAK